MVLISGINALIFPALTGIIIDIKRPKLTWDNEQKAVKQNLNVLINMVIAIIGGILVIVPIIIINLNPLVSVIILFSVYGLINLIMYSYLKKNSDRLFMKLEA